DGLGTVRREALSNSIERDRHACFEHADAPAGDLNLSPVDQLTSGLDLVASGQLPLTGSAGVDFPERLNGHVERTAAEARSFQRCIQDSEQIWVCLLNRAITIKAAELAVGAVDAQDFLDLFNVGERGVNGTFRVALWCSNNRNRHLGSKCFGGADDAAVAEF